MQIKIVEGLGGECLERNMNYEIEELMKENKEIIDIKFGGAIKKHAPYGTDYEYSAMIIYK